MLYDYHCQCGSEFELNKKMDDRDNTGEDICGECGETGKLTRMVSAPLVGYSTVVNGGYGSKIPDGFKEVLHKIHSRAPGSILPQTSSFM